MRGAPPGPAAVLTVAGEALIDVITRPDGVQVRVPGGAALNAARAAARLGARCRYVGGVSADADGDRIAAALAADGVESVIGSRVPAPCTTAVAHLDAAGVARYRFSLAGTSAAHLRPGDLPPGTAGSVEALLVGGLALVCEPVATTLAGLVGALPARAVTLLDPNCRPGVTPAGRAGRVRLAPYLRRADIVKLSDADAAHLHPGRAPAEAARELLAAGPAAVMLTRGPDPVLVVTAGAEAEVPVPPVTVVDTVGAGDAFAAAVLVWWCRHGLGRRDADRIAPLTAAAAAAAEVAALACTRRGADPAVPPGWPDGTP